MADLFSKLCGLMEMMEEATEESSRFDFSIGTLETITLNHEQYIGSFKWRITNTDEMDKVLNAANSDYYESNTFEISETKWCIKLNPNGSNVEHKGAFGIHLRLQSLPKLWESVLCRITIKYKNNKYSHKQCCLFQRDNIGGTNCFMLLGELIQNDIKQLVFTVDINILRVIAKKNEEIVYQKNINNNYNKNTDIEWNINRPLKTLKTYRIGQVIQSDIYDNMWMIECYPNGDKLRLFESGLSTFKLRLFYLPPNTSKLMIKWTIYCKELNKEKTMMTILDSDKTSHSWITSMKMADFTNFTNINIKSSVLILDQYMIDKDNYISMIETAKQWNKYVQILKVQNQTTNNNNDQRTEYIINGYVRNIEKILRNLYDNNSYYTIPSSIIQILFLLIDDYFTMNKGSFIWSMDQEFITNKILNAVVNSKVRSNIFEMGNKLKWFVDIYPHKKSFLGSFFFSIYIGLISMPSEWKSIFVSLSIECIEINRKFIRGAIYKQNNTTWGSRNFLQSEKLKELNPTQLTFVVNVNISKIFLNENNCILYQCIYPKYQKKTKIELMITEDMLKSDGTYNNNKQRVQSDVCDDIWILECELDGDRMNRIDLRLIGFPLDVLNIKVQWTLYWKQQDLRYTNIDDFHEEKMLHYCKCNDTAESDDDWDSRLIIDDCTSYKMIHFIAEIVILEDKLSVDS